MEKKNNFLEASKLQFAYYRRLGQRAMEQLVEKELLDTLQNQDANSIAIIVNHLHGNMLSRWTDFLTTDGEKSFRNRDQEFEDIIHSEKVLWERWNEGWECVENVIHSLIDEDLDRIIYIRNQGHTVTEAMLRQLSHYAYHIGQIVFMAKEMKGDHWQSLSIPKGKSKEYNQDKMNHVKHKEHFTKEYLDKK